MITTELVTSSDSLALAQLSPVSNALILPVALAQQNIAIAALNYQAGTINYLELLNAVDLLAKNEQKYLSQLLMQNQTVAYYRFLTNE